jgi:hypothetical protein
MLWLVVLLADVRVIVGLAITVMDPDDVCDPQPPLVVTV